MHIAWACPCNFAHNHRTMRLGLGGQCPRPHSTTPYVNHKLHNNCRILSDSSTMHDYVSTVFRRFSMYFCVMHGVHVMTLTITTTHHGWGEGQYPCSHSTTLLLKQDVAYILCTRPHCQKKRQKTAKYCGVVCIGPCIDY